MWPVKVRYAINALTPWYYRKTELARALRDQTARTAICWDACTAQETTQQPVPNVLMSFGQILLKGNAYASRNRKNQILKAFVMTASLTDVHLVLLIKVILVISVRTHQFK